MLNKSGRPNYKLAFTDSLKNYTSWPQVKDILIAHFKTRFNKCIAIRGSISLELSWPDNGLCGKALGRNNSNFKKKILNIDVFLQHVFS